MTTGELSFTRGVGPDGYRLVLPAGWVQLDVRQDLDKTIADVLTEMPFDGIPRDERPRRRATVEGRLRRAIAAARTVDAYAMYVPLKGMQGSAVPASFVVADATDFSGGPPHEVLRQLLSSPDAQPVDVDGVEATRTETTTTGVDEPTETEVHVRQVVYTVPVPDSLQWLIVVYEIVIDERLDVEARNVVDALVTLFDAVMTTFRWLTPTG